MTGERSLRYSGAVVVLLLMAAAVIGPWLAPFAPDAWAGGPLERPTRSHWLGTDDLGHDLLSIMLHGATYSVGIAVAAGGLACALGALVGASSGYLGGRWGGFLGRLTDWQMALPALPLMLVITFYGGPSLALLISGLVVSLWGPCARELRASAAVLRERDFVVAQRAMGAHELSILVRHILPSLAAVLWAQFAHLAHRAVLLESALAFLGMGDPNRASWGRTLYQANVRAAFLSDAWVWWALPPGLAIAALGLGFALLGVDSSRQGGLASAPTYRIRPRRQPPIGNAPPAPPATLFVDQLRVGYATGEGEREVLRDISLTIQPGEVVGLAGPSGAGKSTFVHTLLGLLPPEARVEAGTVELASEDLLGLPEASRRRLAGVGIAWVPQAAMDSLNPVRRVGKQVGEVAGLRMRQPADRERLVNEVLAEVGLPAGVRDRFAHTLSGGERQRVVIAMALCREPRLLIADEPTSGLDRSRAEEIARFLVNLCRDRGRALLIVSHDLPLLRTHADRILMLDNGQLGAPAEPEAIGDVRAPRRDLAVVRPSPPQAGLDPSRDVAAPVLEMRDVRFRYRGGSNAVVQCSHLTIRAGEAVGLMGPSGAGKSTLARLAVGLCRPERGEVRLFGRNLADLRGAELRAHRRRAHFVFQDPHAALPEHLDVGAIVAEPLRIAGVGSRLRAQAAHAALAAVQLEPARYHARQPRTLSGGERQRVALARALVARPDLIVADEPTSMLDSALKENWLDCLDGLRREMGTALLLITHDLSQARAYCDRIALLGGEGLSGVFPADEHVCSERLAGDLPSRRADGRWGRGSAC